MIVDLMLKFGLWTRSFEFLFHGLKLTTLVGDGLGEPVEFGLVQLVFKRAEFI